MNGSLSAALPPPPEIDAATAAFFLDFDGTLAPIAPRPELARMAEATRAALVRLAANAGGAVAVVSGRTLADLDAMLAPLTLPAAGSHGLERRDGAGRLHEIDGGPEVEQAIAAVFRFADANGLLAERKRAGAAMHYRARPELEAECRAVVDRAARAAPGMRTVHGQMIAELALAGVDKGHAIEAFMAEPPFRGRLPVFVGDDLTDEDGFRAVRAMDGVAVKVGPGPTAADHRLADIAAFLAWLDRVAA